MLPITQLLQSTVGHRVFMTADAGYHPPNHKDDREIRRGALWR